MQSFTFLMLLICYRASIQSNAFSDIKCMFLSCYAVYAGARSSPVLLGVQVPAGKQDEFTAAVEELTKVDAYTFAALDDEACSAFEMFLQ